MLNSALTLISTMQQQLTISYLSNRKS